MPQLKLYLISQNVNCDYDTYDSAVVAAENSEEARLFDPAAIDGSLISDRYYRYGAWVHDFADVAVMYIGDAAEGISKGVICASFNAG